MKRPATSSSGFSPNGWSSWPSGHSSRDDALFLLLPPLPLPFGFGFGHSWRLGYSRFPSSLLLTVLHHLAIRATPEAVAIELLWIATLVFSFAAFLGSLGLGKGINSHGRRSGPMHVGLQELLDRQSPLPRWIYGRGLHSKVISEDAHHVYRSPEVPHIIAESLANHSQLLLESHYACNRICVCVWRQRRQWSRWL